MRPRAILALPALLALGLAAAGCFNQSSTGQTITQAVTIGVGTQETVVNPGGPRSGTQETQTGTQGTTGQTQGTTGQTQTATGQTQTAGSGTTSGQTQTGASADLAKGKQLFLAKCGACHTLADAGTNGSVGPNLDDVKPDQATVEHQIANAAPPMPRNLYTGNDAKTVAAYVAAVAGKSS